MPLLLLLLFLSQFTKKQKSTIEDYRSKNGTSHKNKMVDKGRVRKKEKTKQKQIGGYKDK